MSTPHDDVTVVPGIVGRLGTGEHLFHIRTQLGQLHGYRVEQYTVRANSEDHAMKRLNALGRKISVCRADDLLT